MRDFTIRKYVGYIPLCKSSLSVAGVIVIAVDEIFGENNIKLLGGNVWVKPL